MIDYYTDGDLLPVKTQRKKLLIAYFSVGGFYLIASLVLFVWYFHLPYASKTIGAVKAIQFSLTGLFVIFTFVFFGIPFYRTNKFYRLCENLKCGVTDTTVADFLRYSEEITEKDGVECKSLIFSEDNKYNKGIFERKVLVFNEREFPKFNKGDKVRFITHGNFLLSYEILESKEENKEIQ